MVVKQRYLTPLFIVIIAIAFFYLATIPFSLQQQAISAWTLVILIIGDTAIRTYKFQLRPSLSTVCNDFELLISKKHILIPSLILNISAVEHFHICAKSHLNY